MNEEKLSDSNALERLSLICVARDNRPCTYKHTTICIQRMQNRIICWECEKEKGKYQNDPHNAIMYLKLFIWCIIIIIVIIARILFIAANNNVFYQNIIGNIPFRFIYYIALNWDPGCLLSIKCICPFHSLSVRNSFFLLRLLILVCFFIFVSFSKTILVLLLSLSVNAEVRLVMRLLNLSLLCKNGVLRR